MARFRKPQHARKHEKRPNVPPKNDDIFNDEADEIGNLEVKRWHEDIAADPDEFKPLPENEVNQLREEARVVLENDTLHYRNKSSRGQNRSNSEWLHTMVTKGTFQDKIAASVVLIQNSPLHGLGTIRNLVNQVKSVKDHTKVMGVLTDLFISDLLVPEKKLRPFEKRPLSLLEKLSNGSLVKRKFYLTTWYFEDQLKNEYRKFIQGLIEIGRDTVESNREHSIYAMQKLLIANPEQEVLLLSSLVNKIGDPSRAVASKTIYCLGEVLKEHPKMKIVVMEEIEKLLFRPNINERAQYYSICFLSQYILRKENEELANRLIEIYFSFFKACIKKGDVDAKIMSAVLVGVKRAFPFANKDGLKLKEHIETMYKIVHIAHFNVSLHVLCLLFQLCDQDTAISDRFYSVLYRKVLDPALSSSSHHATFISLVFQALSKDLEQNRIKVFIKRLLQICHYVPVPLACGILIMISHLFKNNKNLEALVLLKTEFNEDDEEGSDGEHYEDVKLEEIEEQKENPSDDITNLEVISESVRLVDKSEKKPVIASWLHVTNSKEDLLSDYKKRHNVNARNPLFLGSEVCVYTEIVSLATHFHPTVSLYANHLLEGTTIKYSGDPLNDFTLQYFLDRWVFKNPKNLASKKPKSKLSRQGRHSSRVKTLAITSEEYLNIPEGLIPPEELFLYRHLKKKQEEGKLPHNTKGGDDDDVSSVASDEFDGMMGQLMGGKEEIDFAKSIKKLPPEAKTSKKKEKRGELDDDSEEEEEEEEVEDEDLGDDVDGIDMSDIGSEESEGDEGSDDGIDYSDIKEEFSDLDELNDDDDVISFDGDDDDGDGEEEFAFTMSDVEQDELERKQGKKNKKSENKKTKKAKGIDGSVFAPVEQFAQMLEDTGDQFAKFGNLANVSNKDKAGMKQLKWEMDRNQWIHGHREKRKRPGGGGSSGLKKSRKKFKR